MYDNIYNILQYNTKILKTKKAKIGKDIQPLQMKVESRCYFRGELEKNR